MFTGLLNTMAVPMGFVEMRGQQKYCSCHLNSNTSVSQTTGVMSPTSPQGSSSLPLPDLIMSHNPTGSQPMQQSRTFVFPSSGTGAASSQTSTASQTTPSLTRTPVLAQFSSTILDSPIIRPSATIFSLPSTPSTSSQVTENLSSHATSETSSRLTELPVMESDRPADIGPLDYSASALKRRRSRAFGYSPPFESNVVLDSPEDTNSSKTESTSTTTSSSLSDVPSIGPSALVIANIVLPRDSDLVDESNSETEEPSQIVGNERSNSTSDLPSRLSDSNDHDFVVNHCIPMCTSPFTLDECRALEKANNNLKHIVHVQDRLSDPFYDWPSPVGGAGGGHNLNVKDRSEYFRASSRDSRVYYRYQDQPGGDGRRSIARNYEVSHRRLLNDRNHLRMSWELPPSPPPLLPPQVPDQPALPADLGSHHPAADASYRERESKFLMKCVGEDLRNIADQFEVSCGEVAPRRTLPTLLSEALFDGPNARAAVGKCIAVSVIAILCWNICSKAAGSFSR